MKCSFCGKTFTPSYDEDICDDCISSVDELTNGKGDADDD